MLDRDYARLSLAVGGAVPRMMQHFFVTPGTDDMQGKSFATYSPLSSYQDTATSKRTRWAVEVYWPDGQNYQREAGRVVEKLEQMGGVLVSGIDYETDAEEDGTVTAFVLNVEVEI